MAEISGKQIGCMHALAKQLGMDHDDLHNFAGVPSLKALSSFQAIQIIDQLKTMAGQEPNQPRRGKPTPKEMALIEALTRELGWDAERQRKFLEKRFHVSHIRFLSDEVGWKVIEAMKAMLKGGRGERRRKTDGGNPPVAT